MLTEILLQVTTQEIKSVVKEVVEDENSKIWNVAKCYVIVTHLVVCKYVTGFRPFWEIIELEI